MDSEICFRGLKFRLLCLSIGLLFLPVLPVLGELKIAEISTQAGELKIGVHDSTRSINSFVLQQSVDPGTGTWNDVSSEFTPTSSAGGEFRMPLNDDKFSFFRVLGGIISGAPVPMSQVSGGVLPALSSLGALDVAGYFMGTTEVTWAEWRAVREWAVANGYDLNMIGEGCDDLHPVHSVSWYDALKWCNARSEQAGLTPVYTVGGSVYRSGEVVPDQDVSASGYRLPKESEWEFAARGGTLSQGYTYSGGNDLAQVAWYFNNASSADCDMADGRGTWSVAQKAANELGQYDMNGNVGEWCWDAVAAMRRVRGGGVEQFRFRSRSDLP